MKKSKVDNSRYYNNVVIKIMNGEKFGNWNKLIEYVLSLPKKEAMKDYPELMQALELYNKIESVWNKIQSNKNQTCTVQRHK